MTLPRSSYGGYIPSSSWPETPIYDLLVSERGTPQIAPIRVPSEYTPGEPSSLPSALPALPSGPGSGHQQAPQGYPGQQNTGHGMPYQGAPPAPLHQSPATYGGQQPQGQWPQPQQGYQQQPQYQAPQRPQPQQPYPQPQRQQPPQMQPVAPRPAMPRQTATPYDDPYGGSPYPGRGY